ncbi:MAG: TonB family protein [Candidatus Eremiobacteraeota bacterium]|nr:TonB family protein [Candidatus Eremiobacteraeota bacterium]
MAVNKDNQNRDKKAAASPFLTTGESVRNFLGWAFIISVVAHLLLGPLVPWKQAHTADQDVEKVSMSKKVKVKVPTPPPPTPTPRPTQQPKETPPPKKQEQHPQPKLKVEPPKTSNGGAGPGEAKYVPPKGGSQNGVPQGSGSSPAPAGTVGPPASTPTPKPQCATPFKDATPVNLVSPEYPESAKEANIGPAVVIVKITLSASASVLDASVISSSGNSALDRAAISAAKQSSYSPKVVDCAPVTGDYSFRANFDPSS